MIPAVNKERGYKTLSLFFYYCCERYERWRMLSIILCVCIWLWNGNVYRVFVSIIYKVYFSLLLNIMLCRCLRTVKISFSFFFVTCFGLCLFLCMHHFYNIKSKKVNRRSLLIHVLQKKLKTAKEKIRFG